MNSLCIGFTISTEAVLLICMCLMFSHGPCIPDGVKIKATYSALQAWIELSPVTSGERTESHVPVLYSGPKYTVLLSTFLFWELLPLRSRDPEPSLTLSHRCCVSLHDFIINGCQCVAQKSKAERSARSQLCLFWSNLWVNLSANDCRSWGKTLDVHSP